MLKQEIGAAGTTRVRGGGARFLSRRINLVRQLEALTMNNLNRKLDRTGA
jgi:hypothetical protein